MRISFLCGPPLRELSPSWTPEKSIRRTPVGRRPTLCLTGTSQKAHGHPQQSLRTPKARGRPSRTRRLGGGWRTSSRRLRKSEDTGTLRSSRRSSVSSQGVTHTPCWSAMSAFGETGAGGGAWGLSARGVPTFCRSATPQPRVRGNSNQLNG